MCSLCVPWCISLAKLAKVLTDAAARRLTPQRERRTVSDGAMPGLNLIIQSSGHKSFQMRFRGLGKLTLGPFDAYGHELAGEPAIGMPLTVAAARQLAAWIHRERALGRNPIADHRAREHRRRAEQEQAASNSFAASVRMFIDEHARPKTRRWHETAKLLGLRWEDLEPIPGDSRSAGPTSRCTRSTAMTSGLPSTKRVASACQASSHVLRGYRKRARAPCSPL